MVACFWRHLEYCPAILFITTNRVNTFDEALLSRIHIPQGALHFHPLSMTVCTRVWTAFLQKAGVVVSAEDGIAEGELRKLPEKDINGRQNKNTTRTSNSLVLSRREALRFRHAAEVLDVMDEFTAEFKGAACV